MPDYVKIHPNDIKVAANHPFKERDIEAYKAKLLAGAQIAPLHLCKSNSIHHEERIYAEAQVLAARALGWTTLLAYYEE